MLLDGFALTDNARVLNSRIDYGQTLPIAPKQGQIFLLLAADGSHSPGVWNFNGTVWKESGGTDIIAGQGLSEAANPNGSGTILAIDRPLLESIFARIATTLAGYGITDAYSKAQVDAAIKSAVPDSLVNKADKAATLAGYGITDAFTKTETNTALAAKATKATTLSGYGITDAYTKTETNTALTAKPDKATTLFGYGITDAYTKTETADVVNAAFSSGLDFKADKATTLAGYGITDAYTKAETDSAVVSGVASVTASILDGKADKSTTLDGYGITDAFTKSEISVTFAQKATTLFGYGITDGMPKSGGVFTGPVSLSQDPQSPMQVATKQYVDSIAQGLDPKASVRVKSASNLSLIGLQFVDDVFLNSGDRVLVAGQTNAAQNGIYLASTGAWTRTQDARDTATVSSGLFTFVSEGTAFAGTTWVLVTKDPISVGTTNLVFSQLAGGGSISTGYGLTQVGNQVAVDISKLPYDIAGSCIGKPPVGATLFQFLVVRPFSIPLNAVGSSSNALATPKNTTQLSIQKNGSQFGQITYLAGTHSGAISCSPTSFALGDILSIVAPELQDDTLADISYTFAAILI